MAATRTTTPKRSATPVSALAKATPQPQAPGATATIPTPVPEGTGLNIEKLGDRKTVIRSWPWGCLHDGRPLLLHDRHRPRERLPTVEGEPGCHRGMPGAPTSRHTSVAHPRRLQDHGWPLPSWTRPAAVQRHPSHYRQHWSRHLLSLEN